MAPNSKLDASRPPALASLVCDLWSEFLNAGGYDLLPMPFDQDEVLRTISLATRQWNDETRHQHTMSATA